MKPNMFEMSRTFSRYLKKKFEIFRKKNWEFLETYLGDFSWYFYLGLREGPFDHLPPFCAENWTFKTLYLLSGWSNFDFFFNFDILMVISFRNHHQISYNTENKIWRELCEILFPPKIPKSEKQKHTILGNIEFKIVANFQVNCVKTKKDEWKWAFLMSHMPTVLVKLFWTFGIKIEYIEQSVWLLGWNFKKITNNQICL